VGIACSCQEDLRGWWVLGGLIFASCAVQCLRRVLPSVVSERLAKLLHIRQMVEDKAGMPMAQEETLEGECLTPLWVC
jgi:hypothetical protein